MPSTARDIAYREPRVVPSRMTCPRLIRSRSSRDTVDCDWPRALSSSAEDAVPSDNLRRMDSAAVGGMPAGY